jgi:general secretion pathway protein D
MITRPSTFCWGFLVLLTITACATRPKDTEPTEPRVPPQPAPSVVDLGEVSPPAEPLAREVIPGTGKLVEVPAEQPSAAPAPGDGFQLNFVDTEISTVVAAVLGDGLNLPYVIDNQIKGTMTLQATRALSRDELFASFDSALRMHGAVLVNENGVFRVVPAKDAARRITNLRASLQSTRGYGVYVVPLQFVSPADMEKVLQPFAPEGGIVRVDEARNLLLLAGTRQEVTTLLSVVETFDVDWLAGMSFGLYPLEYVDPRTLTNELSQVFSGSGSPIAGVVRFVPLTRLNSLMVITSQARYLQEVQAWIKRLDLGSTTPGRRIYVYDVQNGKADDLASSLGSILSIDAVETGQAPNDGDGYDLGIEMRDFGFGDRGANGGANSSSGRNATRVTVPAPAAPPSSAPAKAADQTRPTALDAGALKIVPNTENNSLLILASPAEFAVIETALKRLDVLPIQVLIEASIAEVTLTDDIRYGLQFSFQGGDGPLVLSEASSGSVGQQFPGFSYLYTGRTDIRAVLNGLEELTNVRVISAPKLIVLNNREAQLQVGDQVPITVQSSVSTIDPTAPIVNSIQLRDTGVILRVTPRANKSGRVILEVAQEVSDVVQTTSSGIDSPTIQQRRIASTVAVRDGDTIALGGLIRDQRSSGGSGIPYLRKIPVLGPAFGSSNRGTRRTELIVLLTPHVIRTEEESDAVMDELREQFRGLQRALPVWEGKQIETPPRP